MSLDIIPSLPNVADAEEHLIGAVLSGFNPDDIDLTAAEFYDPTRADIWDAIRRVKATGQPPNPTSVRLALADRQPPIDPIRLLDYAGQVPIVTHAPYYAQEIRATAGLRALLDAGNKISRIAMTPGDLETRREEARQAIDDACKGHVSAGARRLADLLPAALDAAEHGKSPVLATGWPDLDRMIGGLAPGRLVVFGARPGGGKSLAATNLALQFAHQHQHAALIVSLEMPEAEVINRLLAAHARVNLTNLSEARVDEASWDKLAAKHAELDAMPLYINDDASLTVQGIRRVARDVQRERDDLALIAVDYLQLVSPGSSRKSGSRAEEVSTINRGLKLLARETGACVVAMAQVNREGAGEHGPRLTDLREGGIENDADQVILLHRPSMDTPEIRVEVAKNRHGPTGFCTWQLAGHYARLTNTTWTPSTALGGTA